MEEGCQIKTYASGIAFKQGGMFIMLRTPAMTRASLIWRTAPIVVLYNKQGVLWTCSKSMNCWISDIINTEYMQSFHPEKPSVNLQ